MSMGASAEQEGTTGRLSKSSRTVRPRGAPVIRRPPWLVTATAATCLVAGGTWATVAHTAAHHGDTGGARPAGGSDRFLQLTGDHSSAGAERGEVATRE